ncbi:segregation and condensation protein A [Gluconobacter wancherniae]|uniref:Segregation and condensation protein A n=1 Tax=Gluconobacter wancherniae NBRC 103581 TaxID=656744 RepID=A0A511AWP4_9PROT|nr:ScpA family protein [Gluconobacter wancherniae]MBF0852815.1 segregation/condensation protein A [Gluconobacter wancherniae]MBS1087702.1 segregation/condensation protein A [Gluconobacter wancherniae]MBS1093384.1 segregation/condensation protein A [Gluconobacter wancherniae]GBD56469.1 segregation/condensation protein A [Gluconobacter wancherniae NBRC 103581]GBR63926.1 chromosome segregation and condensation protein ScpA [Gluconobacter wancherniae NBRC 103581]
MTEVLHLTLDGFEGPLDLLLDLARAQKVDLAGISILQLVEQYLSVVETAQKEARSLRLELAADWLVMAAWLAWLKSKLLLPAESDSEDVEEAAGLLQERLIELEQMREGARWLGKRPRLGEDVFERGEGEDHTEIDRTGLRVDLSALVAAYLSAGRRTARKRVYAPRVLRYWSIQDALARLRRMLGAEHVAGWHTLVSLLPDELDDAPHARSAALAGTLLAGLEMAKGGAVELRQPEAFGVIEWRALS